MLPMLPRRPILLGGVTTPLIWTGLLHEVIAFVNPLMDERINWWWFAASQVAFGVVAGLVVARQEQSVDDRKSAAGDASRFRSARHHP